ncbi:endonuclease G, mitochondrial-like [Ylistrum balloti]|uniref:endonuclease G, mitochondrial-like n=1 Tax=Ylistrum balloti TaxID=509963 RepID=UPI002905F44F|nr:endonuclease G, mitochondrial-like [Ylistrum balloti]
MKQFRLLATVSALSAGVGVLAGVNYDSIRRIKKDQLENESRNYKYYIPLPTVSAAAPANVDLPTISNTVSPIPVTPSNRVSEIMKYGFPSLDQIRSYDNFVLSYDRRNRTAHWVFEHIKPEHILGKNDTDRENSIFQEDYSIHPYFRATNYDYKSSGYDRGHLAAAANHRHSQHAMDQTFTLSNISPQVGRGFNRDAWNSLEKYVRGIARMNKNVYVCTGPLYLPRREADGRLYIKYPVIGPNNVAVPTHFFKVIAVENVHGDFELMSFVMPNEVIPDSVPIKNFLVPIETIERAGGILLFDKIPKKRFSVINGKRV